MAQTIKLKRGTTTPTNTDIVNGEVAIDTSAKKLYINDGGTVKEIGGGSSATSGAGAPSSTPSAVGDIYIDTTNDVAYIATDTVSSSDWKVFTSNEQSYTRTNYTATASQTTFSASYTVGYVDVYLNGVKLVVGTDFTATSGTDIVLSSGASSGDSVEIIAFQTFNIAALDPALQSIADAGTSTGADQFLVSTGASTVAWESASTARGSMGLGTLATLSSVSNTNWSGTDLSIANGGTGASDAATALTNLGAQASSTVLNNLNTLGAATTGDQFLVSTAAGVLAWESESVARGSLGLGSLATLNSVNNDNWSGTDLSIANGGTGASTAVNAAHALIDGISLTAATVATDDKVLIQDTNGSNVLKTVTAQDIANLAGSGWTLLGSIDSQAAGQTSLAFATDAMSSDYDDFLVTFEEAYRTDSATSAILCVQFFDTAWITSSSYVWQYNPWSSNTVTSSSGAQTFMRTGHSMPGNSAGADTKNMGWFKVIGAKNTAVNTRIIGHIVGDIISSPYNFTGQVTTANVINSLRFLSSAGNIATRAKLFGMKNT